jgi:hypothetical protein
MRTIPTLLLAGVAAAGIAGAALADRDPAVHNMTVELPAGGVAHIQYTGDVAPKVTLDRAAVPFGAWLPASFFAADPAFADLQRISADMEQQFDAMIQQTNAIAAVPAGDGLMDVAAGKLPPGTVSYSMVSTFNGKSSCTRSVEVTKAADGKSKVVRHESGNCGAVKGAASAATQPTPEDSI